MSDQKLSIFPKDAPFNLYNVVTGRICIEGEGYVNRNIILTEEQKEAFVQVIGDGAWQKTKDGLRRFIEAPRSFKAHEIYRRVLFNTDGVLCDYCAGQDYPSEIREIRRLICNNK